MARTQNPISTGTSQPMRFGRTPDSSAKKRRNLTIFVAVLVLVLVLPLIGSVILPLFSSTLYTDILIPVDQVLIYVLLALGLNIVVGYAGLLDLGYAAFFAIGAYTMGFLTSNQTAWYDSFHLNFWEALPVSFIVAGIFGVLLGAPTLRLRGDYLAIVTLGFGEIVPNTFRNANKFTSGDTGLAGINTPFDFVSTLNIGCAKSTSTSDLCNNIQHNLLQSSWSWWYYVAIAVIVISIFLILRLISSRVGRAWMAMREDEIAAAAMGINLTATKLIAFGAGASFAGFAGAIFASALGTANPSQFLFAVSILVLSMIILGGMGNIWGVIFGAIVLGLSDRSIVPFITTSISNIDRNNDFLQNIASGSRLLLFGIILVIMMLVRPEGIFPNSRRRLELQHDSGDELQPTVARSENGIEGVEELLSINYNPSITEGSEQTRQDRR